MKYKIIIITSLFMFNGFTAFASKISGMKIIDNGNVGIGTDTPSQRLDVDGVIKADDITVKGISIQHIASRINVLENKSAIIGEFCGNYAIVQMGDEGLSNLGIDYSATISISCTTGELSIQNKYILFTYKHGDKNILALGKQDYNHNIIISGSVTSEYINSTDMLYFQVNLSNNKTTSFYAARL